MALEQLSIVVGAVIGFWTGFLTRNGAFLRLGLCYFELIITDCSKHLAVLETSAVYSTLARNCPSHWGNVQTYPPTLASSACRSRAVRRSCISTANVERRRGRTGTGDCRITCLIHAFAGGRPLTRTLVSIIFTSWSSLRCAPRSCSPPEPPRQQGQRHHEGSFPPYAQKDGYGPSCSIRRIASVLP